jgi:hypothetical protein
MQSLEIPVIEGLVQEFLKEPQVECPLVHRFSNGIYLREITMPAGTVVIGCKHLTSHFNILLRGKCRVVVGKFITEITAGATWESKAGDQKVVNCIEECVWQTVHLNLDNERDIETLESRLVEPTQAITTKPERELT